MSNSNRPPREVVRAMFPGPELREEGSGATLFGHFATFDDWTEINSKVEGRFMERVAPGAFSKAFQSPQRERVKVLFQHGKDPAVGEQPIASISELRQDRTGAYYEADLLDGVPPLVVSGLRAGQYGASWRFRVTREDFNAKAERSAHNPAGLPERTIREAELYEFGPVTFPAYPTATAGIRSMTDDYLRDILIPVAPSDGAGAEPHSEPERSDEPEPPPEGAPSTDQDPPDGGSSDSRKESPVASDTVYDRTSRPARITGLEAELRTIAAENQGALPPEIQVRWDDAKDELQRLNKDQRADEERMAFLGDTAEKREDSNTERTYSAPNINRPVIRDIYDFVEIRTKSRNPEHENQLLNDSAMRAVEAASFPMDHVDKARASDQVDRLVRGDPSGEVARRILATGSPAYRSFFHKYLVGGWHTAEEQRAAAMTSLTGSSGGFATVWELDPTILPTSNGAVNPYRRIAKVVQTTTNEWRGVTSTGVVAAYAGEAAAATEQGPTLVQPAAIVQKAHTYITFSIEAGEDINNLDGQLGTMISDAKDILEAAQFTTGVGTTVFPQGITVGATGTFNTATTTVVAAADLYTAETTLAPRFRPGAHWVANRFIYNKIRAIDTAGGAQLWTQNLTIGLPNRVDGNTGYNLLGYPADECSGMPASVATTQIEAVLGDFSYFVIIDRIGMNIELVPLVVDGATPSMPTGQRGLYAYWRNTSKVLSAAAFIVMKGL